jgi:cyanophycin synthetase
MQTRELRFFVGANLYAEVPVCRLRLEPDRPGESVAAPLREELLQRCLGLFPWLRGSLAALNDGTIEGANPGQLMLALIEFAAAGLGWRLSHRYTLPGPLTGGLDLVLSYEERHSSTATVNFALGLMQRVFAASEAELQGLQSQLNRDYQAFIQQTARRCWDADTRYLVTEALARHIPVLVHDLDPNLIVFGHGQQQRRMRRKTTPRTSWGAFHFATNKPLANRELRLAGLPVPAQHALSDRNAAPLAAQQVGFPLVVKPATTDMGVGITVGIKDMDSLMQAFDRARSYASSVVLERFLEGGECRLLVIDGKLQAAAQRVPAHVVGDGKHTIRQLVQILNRDPRRGAGKLASASRVVLDEEAEALIAAAGYGTDDIPPAGERVYLRSTSNLSRGGTSIDMTGKVHPDNAAAAESASQIIGLDIAGVDFITPDITRSWKEVGGGICEINPNPGLRMHHSPGEGEPRDVAGPIFRLLYPHDQPATIPVAAITGTNGKTTTTRMVSHILREAGARVGLTCSDGVYVDGEQTRAGDLSGGPAAQQLLLDPRIDSAVLEIARGAILKWGTGIHSCDVAAITNIAEEHLGKLGVMTREDMAQVKGLLVGLARKMVVLGADDPLTAGLARRSRAARLCYVSVAADNPLVSEHIASGQPALRLEQVGDDPCIVLYDKGLQQTTMSVTQLPASLGGLAGFNVENAMFAAAVAYGLGQEPALITRALNGFRSDHVQNPGRLNVYREHPFTVILDYAHNPHGLQAVGEIIDKMPVNGRRIGLFSVRGDDRPVDYASFAEQASKHFDRIIACAPAKKLWGNRQPEEIVELMMQVLRDAGMRDTQLSAVVDRSEAVDTILNAGQPGDLLYIMAGNAPGLWEKIVDFRPG